MTTRKRVRHDPREVRRVRAWCEASKQEVLLEHIEEADLGNRSIQYSAPNNIAISLSIALGASAKARTFFDGVLSRLAACPKKGYACDYVNHADIFDYFEQLQVSVIFAFTAVESFANIAIPVTFSYERVNSKGIREVLSKENIERWCSTTEKVSVILPLVFGIASPKGEPYWSDFRVLEEVRNEIVHPKTLGNKMEIPTEYLKRFFNRSIFDAIDSARSVIDHFCAGRAPLPYFPEVVGVEGPADDLSMMRESLAKHIKPVTGVHTAAGSDAGR